MSINESDFAVLQKQVRVNALGLVLGRIDLYLYKAQIAQRRWGTPGGNDVALEHYEAIQGLLDQTDWPAALEEGVRMFEAHLTRFRGYLKAMDVTRVSFEATRMANAFKALQEDLGSWALSGD